MQTLKLLGHELKKRQLTIIITLLAISALFLYSFSLLNKYQSSQILFLPVLALAFPLVLWTLWNHWQSLREEWQEGTTHLLFSFPISGGQVLLAKGGAAAIAFVVFTLLSAALGGALMVKIFSTIPFEKSLYPGELPQLLLSDGSKLYLQYLLVTFSLLGFSQLAFVIGQLAPRWHGFFSAVGFVFILYLVGKVLYWLAPIIAGLPEQTLLLGNISFNPWYAVAFLLAGLLSAVFAAWLLDHRVDF